MKTRKDSLLSRKSHLRQLAPFDHWGAGWVFAHLLYIYLCSDNLCNQLSMAALG